MSKVFFIIVTGPPGSGKTTLANKLAQQLSIPLITRDTIKEILFETLSDIHTIDDKNLGIASHEILYSICSALLSGNTSFIVESNFKPLLANERFERFKSLYDFSSIQIHCKADIKILYERFKHRHESGERHPGHNDDITYEGFKSRLHNSRHNDFYIGDTVINVDTNDFEKVDTDNLIKDIRREMSIQR